MKRSGGPMRVTSPIKSLGIVLAAVLLTSGYR